MQEWGDANNSQTLPTAGFNPQSTEAAQKGPLEHGDRWVQPPSQKGTQKGK